jgi:hypothetical protein
MNIAKLIQKEGKCGKNKMLAHEHMNRLKNKCWVILKSNFKFETLGKFWKLTINFSITF